VRLCYEFITVALPARVVFDVLSAIRCASREHTYSLRVCARLYLLDFKRYEAAERG